MTCKVSVNDVCAFDAWNAFWLAHGHESTDQVICSGNKFATVATSDCWVDRAHINLHSSSRFVDRVLKGNCGLRARMPKLRVILEIGN